MYHISQVKSTAWQGGDISTWFYSTGIRALKLNSWDYTVKNIQAQLGYAQKQAHSNVTEL